MASNTTKLGLLKKNPVTDGNDTFNIETMLNENWDKIDNKVALIDPATGKLLPGQENAQAPADASVTVKGIVMLEDSVTSTSVTKAATPKSVKDVKDAIPALNNTLTSTSTTQAATANSIKTVNDDLTAHQADNVSHITPAERTSWNAKETPNGALMKVEQTSHKTVKTNKDVNGIYTSIEHKRLDNTLVRKSVLSGGTSPNYTTRTVTFYLVDGITVAKTDVFTLSYDSDGLLISEV